MLGNILICIVALIVLDPSHKASAQQHVEFEENFFWTFGNWGAPHLNVGSSKFRVYNSFAAQIGSYGYWEKTSTGGKTFSHLGDIRIQNPIQGRVVEISETTRVDINDAAAELDIPSINARVGSSFKRNDNASLIGTLWRMNNPLSYLEALKQLFGGNGNYSTAFRSERFRFIASVVMVSNYESSADTEFNGALKATISDFLSADFEASADIDSTSSVRIILRGKNVIGYQWYAVCWEDREPVTVKLHDFTWWATEPDDCNSYEDS